MHLIPGALEIEIIDFLVNAVTAKLAFVIEKELYDNSAAAQTYSAPSNVGLHQVVFRHVFRASDPSRVEKCNDLGKICAWRQLPRDRLVQIARIDPVNTTDICGQCGDAN